MAEMDYSEAKEILVEVAYALPDKQLILPVKVRQGATFYEAVLASDITRHFPRIDPDRDRMGVFGKVVKDPKTEQVTAGDRIEIYRPLIADPKAARAKRADKAKEQAPKEPRESQ